ncbi:hypothetical protein ABVT39_019016 [Epinephelus coioides]
MYRLKQKALSAGVQVLSAYRTTHQTWLELNQWGISPTDKNRGESPVGMEIYKDIQ